MTLLPVRKYHSLGVLLILLLLCGGVFAAEPLSPYQQFLAGNLRNQLVLSEEEKSWLKDHPVIRLGIDADYAPYSFTDRDGNYSGAVPDFLAILEKALDISFEPVSGLGWEQLVTGIRSGRVDAIATAVATPERRDYLEFTGIYLPTPLVITAREDNAESVTTAANLEQKTVALVRGYSITERVLSDNPGIHARLVDSSLAGLQAVAAGEADAFVGVLGVSAFLAQEHGLTNLTIAGRYDLAKNGQRIAVRKDWPELASILDKALAAIPRQAKNQLLERWLPITFNGAAMYFDAPQPLQWTDTEQRWLDDHPTITVAVNNAWPPMNFMSDQGVPRGIGVDFIKAMNKRLNGALQIIPGAWEDIYASVKNREVDALMDITPRNDRLPDFNFTDPYIKIPHVFITRKQQPYISRLEDLNGKSLAVEEGFYLITILKKDFAGIDIHTYPNTSDALHAVAEGRSYAYVGNRAAATYLINTEVISNLEIHGKVKESASINAFGVRKDEPVLRQILQKTLDDLTLRERIGILEKWTINDKTVAPSELNLSDGEWWWLENHPLIRVAGDPSFPPIEFRDEDGHATGIAVEYLDILSDTLGVRFEYDRESDWQAVVQKLQNRELDMFAAAAATPAREQYATFTDPYLKVPVMIFTHQRSPYISSLSDFGGRKVALVKHYAVLEMVSDDNWGIEIVPVPDIVAGLQAVQAGEVDAYIGDALSTSYAIRKHPFPEIHIAGPTPYRLDLAMGVRQDWAQFVPILNKTLAKISTPERDQISARWIGVQVKAEPDYNLYWQALAAGIVLLALFLLWNGYLRAKISQHTARIRGQNRELEYRQQALSAAQQLARLGSWSWNLESGKFVASQVLGSILRIEDNVAMSSLDKFLDHVHPDDRGKVRDSIEAGVDSHTNFDLEYRMVRSDGEVIHVHQQGEISEAADGAQVVSSTVQDITERRQAELTIHKLQQAFDNNPGSVIITDLANRVEYVNRAFSRNTGYSADEVLDTDLLTLMTPPNLLGEYREILDSVKAGNVWQGELLSHKKNGTPFWEDVTIAPVLDREGNVVNLLELRQDLSDRKAIEERLFHCPLTRQPNQALVLRKLEQARDLAHPFTLLFVDLLHLKRINDSLGFEAGDALIIQAARRLDQSLKNPDLIAHLGGGQYLVKLNTLSDFVLEHQIQSILGTFRTPFVVRGEAINQNICIGVVQSPKDGADPNELLSRAHIAANQAKRSRSHNWCFYSEEYSQFTQSQFHMENLLAQALDNNEFSVVFQPKFDVASDRFVGAEALMRWNNAELGQVAPHQFIPVAEQSDLIIPIGRWVIRESIRYASKWHALGFEDFRLSINLSPKQFLEDQLIPFIKDCLEEFNFDSRKLEFELTESLLIENTEQVKLKMQQLRDLGIQLLLDDFGTGFSSLSYLQKFPFNGLKIDRSFIYDYPKFQGNVGLIKAIIAMGKALNMTIVAEGIETREQANFLLSEDCSVFQGYLYGKPMSEKDFLNWLQSQTRISTRA